MEKSVIIIGSGIAGMAAAIRLASKGFSVNVYERNSYPGGKISLVSEQGYSFDAGPSLFTQPQLLEELFEVAGEKMTDYIPYEQLEVSCKYFYENGNVITAFRDKEKLLEEFREKTGEDPSRVRQYLENARKLYERLGSVFLNFSMHRPGTWFHKRILKAIGSLKLAYLSKSLNRYHESVFKSPELIQLFNRYATYNGSDPYRAPAMLSMISHLEHNDGAFYPKGGMITIARALHRLAEKKGVAFHFNSPVTKIIHNEGKARGIVINNQNIFADIIITNADAYLTYSELLHHKPKAEKLLKQERSSSALIFFWGIKKEFPELELHNIFFSSDYRKEFRKIFSNQAGFEDPTIYVNITSNVDSGHAPTGSSNWFVMVNVPSHAGQDWSVITEKLRTYVTGKLSRMLHTDIGALIEFERVMTPADIQENTASYGGALYGSSSNTRMAAFKRHPNYSGYIKNLYFCGGTVHPGGGIPLCLKSAEITADLICSNKKHKIPA